MRRLICLLAAAVLLGACSPDHQDKDKQGHSIWKSQTDSIGQAKAARGQLNAAQTAEQRATDAARSQ